VGSSGSNSGYSVRCVRNPLTSGCIDPAYLEFDPLAGIDNGTCQTLAVFGCTNPVFSEFDPEANADDGSCTSLLGCNDAEAPSMDGYTYGVVAIGEQCWFSENLRTTVYADGTSVPEVLGDGDWASTSMGARSTYGNDPGNLELYGMLYNGFAASNVSGLCPSGWHVSTGDDWDVLKEFLVSDGVPENAVGTALKSTSGWGTNGTDDYGFGGLAGGFRNGVSGPFGNAGVEGNWWTLSGSGFSRLGSGESLIVGSSGSNSGYSVRCVRNPSIFGCTDPAYQEYDASATQDDGTCVNPAVMGCTDSAYLEYDATANTDDGSCSTLVGCSGLDLVSMDGYDYDVVEIGDQCWFAENLRTTVYADGTSIPDIIGNASWTAQFSGARCGYFNDANNVDTYGWLYNWYAVDDARGLCPTGWHVPTDGEWTELEDYITSQGYAGTEGAALKSTMGWDNNGNGTDDLGFSALPGGFRNASLGGNFYDATASGYWWSSSPSGGGYSWYRFLDFYVPDVLRDNCDPRSGFSVRCLRGAD